MLRTLRRLIRENRELREANIELVKTVQFLTIGLAKSCRHNGADTDPLCSCGFRVSRHPIAGCPR